MVTVRSRATQLDGAPATGAEADHVRADLARLPGAEQEVIILALYGRLSHTEISAHLGLTSETVKARMRLGLQKLRPDGEQRSPEAELVPNRQGQESAD